jgi:hypothetical protein
MCDTMTDWEDRIWGYPCKYMTKRQYRRWSSLMDRGDYDEADELRREMVDRWGGPVHCCVRAGMDMAVSPSMGVLGFTAGDIRRMYPEGVPDWVFPKDERLVTEHLAPCPIGFVRRAEPTENGTFDELPDHAPVWL